MAAGKIAHKVRPASVVERDGELVYDGEYVLAPRVNREKAADALTAAGLDADEVKAVLFPDPDSKDLGKLVAAIEKDEDPFGTGEVSDAMQVIRKLLVPRQCTSGQLSFRIDDLPDDTTQQEGED